MEIVVPDSISASFCLSQGCAIFDKDFTTSLSGSFFFKLVFQTTQRVEKKTSDLQRDLIFRANTDKM